MKISYVCCWKIILIDLGEIMLELALYSKKIDLRSGFVMDLCDLGAVS